jgi:hypothetical protein
VNLKNDIAQQLAYILAEAIDDAKYWQLVAEHDVDLAPKRVPLAQLDDHVENTVQDALELFASDSGVRDLLHDALMKSLEGWYEPHEW